MAFPLTEEQRNIVTDRGGELLVSAAAGSGKTRVLVERLLDRVTTEKLDIDRFLVITYTKAAAAELRARIAQELAARLAERPNDRHLRRQSTLVYKAQISTIHAFCSMLLRESGHRLDLDPDFRLCDESEAQVLMVRVLDELLDRRYENLEEGSSFVQLVDTMAAGRDDSRLAQIVLDIYGRIQSHPDPNQWMREQKQVWDLNGITDLIQTPWGAFLMEDMRRQAEQCRDRLTRAFSLAQGDELLEVNYGASIARSLEGIEALLQAESWDQAASCLPIPFPAAGRKKKRSREISPMEEARAAQNAVRLKELRKRCKKQLDQLSLMISGSSAEQLEEIALTRPAVQALMDLVLEFQTAYSKEKRRRSLVDFSDLEHYAVKLLLDEKGQPTELAHHWSARFEEIQVDEYQDTNQVQNAIFSAISNGGKKLFLVGDVKQSIYRFRLADPTIFLRKYDRFAWGEDAVEGQPRKRVLSRNFRSRMQVLEGCNDLFRNIMSTQFGELNYTDEQALVPGATFPEGEDYALELDLLDLSFLGEQDGEKLSKDLMEARFAARRIREMLEKPFLVSDGEGMRPVQPSDIMILLRSPGSVLPHYIRALNEEGIAWSADGGDTLFETTEVNVALSILQIVDNPRQDVALIAALRSPVYGFSSDKLAFLRGESDGDFYSTLVRAAEKGDEECFRFLEQLKKLRFGAGDRTCCQLIWHIYEETNILGIFGAMDGGRERQDNLLSLYALAGQLEESGCRSLFQFLLRLERMREYGAKLTTSAGNREREGVSILSIHRSKGLEKPVVLVCGLSRRLNRDDLMRPVLFHPVLGVGPKGMDQERMVEYPTLARQAVARQLEREMMSEELRLLYVAMTRAKEKLVLSIALTEGIKTLERLGEDLSSPVSPVALEQQQSVGQWVLLHALTRPEASHLRSMADLPVVPCGELGPAWTIHWVQGNSLAESKAVMGRLTDLPEHEKESFDGLAERLRWRYPNLASANIPSKLTATQIKGRTLDLEAAEETLTAGKRRDESHSIERPDFAAEERGLTPAQRGTALHLAMQYLPLDSDHSVEGIKETVGRLVEEKYLTRLQGEAVDPKPLAAFFESELGRRLKAVKEVHREFKFSILIPAQEYDPKAAEGETVLLQGVVDVWFEDEDGITVLDFKSDRIRPGKEHDRGEEYRSQLETYGRALSAIIGKPVQKKILWFFATDRAVEL